jgi:Transposase DDE domain
MTRPPQLTQWQTHLASRFPELPTPVVAVWALYSFGMLLAQVCGLSTVTLFLAKHLGSPYHALRKRLSEFYKEASAKSGVRQGQKRQDFAVGPCFAPLLGWVLSLWSGRHLALAIDVTNLGNRFHVLCVSVVVRGLGIPVAWKVLPAGVSAPWNPQWGLLLGGLRAAVPADWTVLVLGDRGLESADLFRCIVALGWHPLLRVKKGGQFRPKGWRRLVQFHQLVRQPGATFAGEGHAYASVQLRCTLLGCWEAGYDEPWLVLTDLPPEAGQAVWYGLRSWIEQGFKVIKGGGWQWQHTRMDDPGRVERLWLVLAVATLWVVALGAADEVQEAARHEQQELERRLRETEAQAQARRAQEQLRLEKQRAAQQARRARQGAARGQQGTARAARPPRTQQARGGSARTRAHRLTVRGLAVLKAAWEQGQNPLPQQLYPELWPELGQVPRPLTEQEFLSRQT